MSNLELNKGDNFIFGVDVSGSMTSKDCANGASRIDFLKEKVIAFANEASKYDEDGIDVLTFGHQITPYLGVTAAVAADVIGKLKANEMSTATDLLITEAYRMHKAAGKQQTVLFIATDGEPNDQEAVKVAIRKIADDIADEHEFAISILTVGTPSATLQTFLTDLDDNLGAKYDIVDIKALAEVDFISAFAGALND